MTTSLTRTLTRSTVVILVVVCTCCPRFLPLAIALQFPLAAEREKKYFGQAETHQNSPSFHSLAWGGAVFRIYENENRQNTLNSPKLTATTAVYVMRRSGRKIDVLSLSRFAATKRKFRFLIIALKTDTYLKCILFSFTRNKGRQRNKMTGKREKLYIKRCKLWRTEKNMYNSK